MFRDSDLTLSLHFVDLKKADHSYKILNVKKIKK